MIEMLAAEPQGRQAPEPMPPLARRRRTHAAFCVWATFAGCLLIYGLRMPIRLMNPHLWAEDGSIYLTRALNAGVRSITMTYGGYFQGLPQTLVYLYSLATVKYLPMLAAGTSLCAHAAAAACFAGPAYRWLVRSDWVRVATCLAMTMAPGMWETLGSIANMQWVLLLWGGLVLCRDPSTGLRRRDVAAMALIGSGTGAAATLLLPCTVRLAVRAKISSASERWREGGCLVVLAAWTLANAWVNRGADGHVSWPKMAPWLEFGITTALNRFVLQPVLGEINLYDEVWQGLPLTLMGVFLGVLLMMGLFQLRHLHFAIFLAWVVSSWCVYQLAFVSRPDGRQQITHVFGIDRWAVPAAQCALVVWVTALTALGRRVRIGVLSAENAAAAAFLAMYVDTAAYRFDVGPFDGSAPSWESSYPQLEKAIQNRQPIKIACYPTDYWSIDFKP